MNEICIKENSWIAYLACKMLASKQMAIVIGNTIYLHNATKEEFLSNKRWLNHEIVHLQQFRKYGYVRFIILYLWESCLHGYQNNKFESEARAAE